MSTIPTRKGESPSHHMSDGTVNASGNLEFTKASYVSTNYCIYPNCLPCLSIHMCCVNPHRVFVLADPEVFFGSLGQALMSDIEGPASGGILGHLDYMCSVVQHSIQAALGAEQCHGQKLSQALKVSGTLQDCMRSVDDFPSQSCLCLLWSVLFIALCGLNCYCWMVFLFALWISFGLREASASLSPINPVTETYLIISLILLNTEWVVPSCFFSFVLSCFFKYNLISSAALPAVSFLVLFFSQKISKDFLFWGISEHQSLYGVNCSYSEHTVWISSKAICTIKQHHCYRHVEQHQ